MKKVGLFIVVLFCVIFSSCDYISSWKCKLSVEAEFPNAIFIVQPTEEEFRWIVLDSDSSLYYVETMSLKSAKITQKELIARHVSLKN